MKNSLLIILLVWLSSGFAQTTVPNGNFENWTDEYHAESWDGLNYDGTWINFHTFSRSDDAHSGNFAAQIENVTDDLLGIIPGAAFTGTFDFDPLTYEYTFQLGIPITGKPTSLNGYFKYSPVGGDTMIAVVGMFKWDEVEMDLDSIGGGIYFTANPTSNYTNFQVPIEYFSNEDADTMYIMFTASTDSYHEGSKLLVDDVTINYNPSAIDENFQSEIVCFPNPVSDRLYISNTCGFEIISFILTDITGKIVLSGKKVTEPIHLRHIESGIYFLNLLDKNLRSVTKKIRIQH